MTLAAKVLPVRILQSADHQLLIGQLVNVLQNTANPPSAGWVFLGSLGRHDTARRNDHRTRTSRSEPTASPAHGSWRSGCQGDCGTVRSGPGFAVGVASFFVLEIAR